MDKTPQRNTVEEVNGQFSPVIVAESPVKKTPQRGNLTGNPRVVRDLAADTFNSIQRWNDQQVIGAHILKNIVTLKTNAMLEGDMDAEKMYPDGLQEQCDRLEEAYNTMSAVVSGLQVTCQQLEALVRLEKVQNADPAPMFLTWPTHKFGEVVGSVARAYQRELQVKRCVRENVAHCCSKETLVLHAAAWVHQPYVTADVDLAVESLLQETGHR